MVKNQYMICKYFNYVTVQQQKHKVITNNRPYPDQNRIGINSYLRARTITTGQSWVYMNLAGWVHIQVLKFKICTFES